MIKIKSFVYLFRRSERSVYMGLCRNCQPPPAHVDHLMTWEVLITQCSFTTACSGQLRVCAVQIHAHNVVSWSSHKSKEEPFQLSTWKQGGGKVPSICILRVISYKLSNVQIHQISAGHELWSWSQCHCTYFLGQRRLVPCPAGPVVLHLRYH